MRDQREVFPGLDSGPNGSEGHYFYALEKRPSGPSLYTTYSKTKLKSACVLFALFNVLFCTSLKTFVHDRTSLSLGTFRLFLL